MNNNAMTPEELFFSWMLYGKLVEFGIFGNVFLYQLGANFPWVM